MGNICCYTQDREVDSAEDGEPPPKILDGSETIKFTVHNFKERNHKWGEYIESPVLRAHGYDWRIRIYPRGDKRSLEEKELVSVFISYEGCEQQVTAQYLLSIKSGWDSGVPWGSRAQTYKLQRGGGWVLKKRKKIIQNNLEDDGSLVVAFEIWIAEKSKRVWYPKRLERQDHLIKLYREDASDVSFVVEDSMYGAHKAILSLQATKLYELAKEWEGDRPIPINSMRGDIFKMILDYIYTVGTPKLKNLDDTKDLLIASDCYECLQLKLYVESVMVDKFLEPENAADLLLFGDSHSCALLKEAAVNLFVGNMKAFKNAEAWSKIEESLKLMTELVQALTDKPKTHNGTTIDRMTVARLRKELEKASLALDGSRKILVNRLKTHRETKNEAKKQRIT